MSTGEQWNGKGKDTASVHGMSKRLEYWARDAQRRADAIAISCFRAAARMSARENVTRRHAADPRAAHQNRSQRPDLILLPCQANVSCFFARPGQKCSLGIRERCCTDCSVGNFQETGETGRCGDSSSNG